MFAGLDELKWNFWFDKKDILREILNLVMFLAENKQVGEEEESKFKK